MPSNENAAVEMTPLLRPSILSRLSMIAVPVGLVATAVGAILVGVPFTSSESPKAAPPATVDDTARLHAEIDRLAQRFYQAVEEGMMREKARKIEVQQLNAMLASAKAEKAKQEETIQRLSSEVSDLKKQLAEAQQSRVKALDELMSAVARIEVGNEVQQSRVKALDELMHLFPGRPKRVIPIDPRQN